MQRLREAEFGNVIDMSDIGDGHPRVHGRHITALDAPVILLEMLISLDCAGGGEKC